MSYGKQGAEIEALYCVSVCVCVCPQCQPDIDHIHRSRTVSGVLPATLTSVCVALILLVPLFSRSGAQHP